MPVPDKCVRRHSESEFSVEEHQSQVIFLNANLLEIHQVEVDGCVYTDKDSKRCDWLVNVHGIDTSIFVELKGSDIDGAFNQLAQTQLRLTDWLRRHIIWIISYSGNPRFNSSIQILTIRARRDYRARLRVERSPHKHTL